MNRFKGAEIKPWFQKVEPILMTFHIFVQFRICFCYPESPHVRESKTVSDSGFHAVDSGVQVLDYSLCQWNTDTRFQSLLRFRTPKPRILQAKCSNAGLHKQKCPGFQNPNSLLTWGESKVTERAVTAQLSITFGSERLLEEFQSDWKCHHNTETSLLKVHNDPF